MLYNGVIVASVAVDAEGRLRGAPKVSAPGLFDPEDTETMRLAADLRQALAELPAAIRRDDAALADAARTALRRALGRRLQKRPLVDVHLIRI